MAEPGGSTSRSSPAMAEAALALCTGDPSVVTGLVVRSTEYLETIGVPVIGYQSDEFPAFYSRSSGLGDNVRADTPAEVAAIAIEQWNLGFQGAVLVTAPPPPEAALPDEAVEANIQTALEEAHQQGVSGSAVTPFLLRRVSELSHGASLHANLALLRNNARIAAQISAALALPGRNL